jgi:protein phosphatase
LKRRTHLIHNPSGKWRITKAQTPFFYYGHIIMTEQLPRFEGPCIIVLIGPAGSGKSTWTTQQFPDEVVLSSDELRRWITDDADEQSCSKDAFQVLGELAELRLKYGRRVIIDATNVKADARRRWWELARHMEVPAAAIWFDVPLEQCIARQQRRTRKVGPQVIERQRAELGVITTTLAAEPWDMIVRVEFSDDDLNAAPRYEVLRGFTPPDRQEAACGGLRVHSPVALDIVGDVHGCKDELLALMDQLGWRSSVEQGWHHPEGRLLVFVGDLVDRGPDSLGVLRLVAELCRQERALLVRGNHDDKLRRLLRGNDVKVDAHSASTVAELDALTPEAHAALAEEVLPMLERSPYWALLDPRPEGGWGVVVAHAAWKPQVARSKLDFARFYCLYGPTTGKIDADGYPERIDWRASYPDNAPLCVVGHTPYIGPVVQRGQTICLDTGCVFGGHLTALRWPEHTFVQIPALRSYTEHAALGAEPRFVEASSAS